MRRRHGGAFVLVAVALLGLCLPLAMMLAGSVLAPRAWAKRARDREMMGHRRVAEPEVCAREVVTPRGSRLELKVVQLAGGFYGELVPTGDGRGALVLEGAGVEDIVKRGTERWDADAKERAARECDAEGQERERAERHALFTWLVATGMPRDAARRVAGLPEKQDHAGEDEKETGA